MREGSRLEAIRQQIRIMKKKSDCEASSHKIKRMLFVLKLNIVHLIRFSKRYPYQTFIFKLFQYEQKRVIIQV